MTLNRISLPLHAALEVIAAPALIAAPFVIDFPVAGGIASFVLGVLLVGLALSAVTIDPSRRTIPLSAHAAFDRLIAVATLLTGVGIALTGGFILATVFMAGFGIAHLALTASTRFSAPYGA
jgi:uncharacterized membrane protein YedE/YeeE